MRHRITENIIAGLLLVFMLVYVVYQASRYYQDPIQTETVFEYTVSNTIHSTGILIRDEMMLDERITGVQNYLFEDASRVSVGERVAEFYESDAGNENSKRIRELEQELDMLLRAQDTTTSNYANIENFNRDIRNNLSDLYEMSSVGKYRDISDIRTNLTALINSKQVATEKATDFSDRITKLQAELDRLEQAETTQSMTSVQAPVSGYFSSSVDGYETKLSPSTIQSWGVDDYVKLVTADTPTVDGNRVGKMVLSPSWLFAAVVPKHEAEDIREGQDITLLFDKIGYRLPATVQKVVDSSTEEEFAVLLISGNHVTEDLINLRVTTATLEFSSHTGLRITASQLRFQGERRGVYILEDNTVRFKDVEPVYEETGFLLSKTNYVNSQDQSIVSLHDQIIVKGNDLYDGKVIQ